MIIYQQIKIIYEIDKVSRFYQLINKLPLLFICKPYGRAIIDSLHEKTRKAKANHYVLASMYIQKQPL